MRKKGVRVLVITAAVVVLIGAALYLANPLGPLLWVLCLAVQLPIVIAVTRAALSTAYRDRALSRRLQFQQDGDAGHWLAAEAREATGAGYRYWSAAARAQNALARAEALAELGRTDDAAHLLAGVSEKKLPAPDRPRFSAVAEKLRQGPGA